MNEKVVQIKDLKKSFDEGRIQALRGIDLEIKKGDYVAIMGPSGCGKSTLLNMIGALDRPDSGEVMIEGTSLVRHQDLSKLRSEKVGYVFQLHNLIPTLTALENVQIPMFEAKLGAKGRKEKAKKLLETVGLKERENNLPTRLSGGERQRVAVARALANDPEIILADEPTGALDSVSAKEILSLLHDIHEKMGTTIIMVSHDKGASSWADQLIHMLDGKMIRDEHIETSVTNKEKVS